ncbi:MAG: hypothetical protein ABL863_11370 [Nitrosomonas sp.]
MKTTKTVRTIICLAIVAVLTACATAGNKKLENQTESSVSNQIAERKTTKAQIISQFGNDARVTFTDSGNELWTYKFSRSIPDFSNFIPFIRWFSSGADVITKELVVIFNQEGIVSKYTMNVTESRVEAGFLR